MISTIWCACYMISTIWCACYMISTIWYACYMISTVWCACYMISTVWCACYMISTIWYACYMISTVWCVCYIINTYLFTSEDWLLFFYFLTPADEVTLKLWKIRNYLPNNTTSHPGRPESSLALLWEPQIT
jgi:hypothetical protein